MSNLASTRILLVDDHPIVRMGLKAMFEARKDVSLVSEAADGPQALALLRTQTFQIALLDLRLPGLCGPALIEQIRHINPNIRIIVFSGFASEEEVFAAFQAGARGYIQKCCGNDEINAAVQAVLQGHRWMPPVIAALYSERLQRQEITPREREILHLLSAGMNNRSIANTLHVAESTIRNRISALFAKLGTNDRMKAVAIATQRGLVSHIK